MPADRRREPKPQTDEHPHTVSEDDDYDGEEHGGGRRQRKKAGQTGRVDDN